MNRSLQSKQKGSILALILIALVVLLITGVGLLGLGLRGRILAIRNASNIVARCAADAGLTKAIFEMNKKLEVKPWSDNALPKITDESLPNCDAVFSYAVTADSNSSGSYTIESTGNSNQAKRKVNGTLRLKGLFEYALFTKEGMELKNGTEIDWYNYDTDDENLKIGTNSTEKAAMSMKAGVIINGDVAVGVGGDTDVVINSKSEAKITGEAYALSEPQELPVITVPEWLQLLPSQGAITSNITINNSGKYDSINLSNSDIMAIDGAVSLYVIGDVILNNSAQLQIVDVNTNPDASLILYLGGNLITKNGGTINNMSLDPKKLQIYGLDNCTKINFMTSSDYYGVIYAPNADVQLHNSVEFFGAVVANSFIQDVFADFHYDASLRDANINDEGVRFVVKRWYEE